MMASLSQQPVSIAIQADQREFQLYKSGVFTSSCGTNLDHGVLAVGYGSEDGVDYYLVKNSWSNTWGDGGYIKLGRGKQYNNGDGQCGMLLQASYPTYSKNLNNYRSDKKTVTSDTCTGPHEFCCEAPGDPKTTCPSSAYTSDCAAKGSCCCA